MAIIKDLTLDVKRKLANRDDVALLAPYWIRDTLREFTTNYPFTELEAFGPVTQLVIGIAAYDITTFTINKELPTDISVFELYTDYPTNSLTTIIKYREPMVVFPISKVSSLPRYWTRHGKSIVLGPNPANPFSVAMSYQRKHQFDESSLDVLNGTLIQIPDDWLELIVIGAAERGALELRLPDYVTLYHQILFGDPKSPDKPGLIQARLSQHQRDKSHNEGQFCPRVERYTR